MKIIFLILLLLPILAISISFSIKLSHDHNDSFSSSLALRSPKSGLIPNEADHVMEFSIGTPPVKVRAILDTGSDLLWSRCKPCIECNGNPFPVFDPEGSSTYSVLPCDSGFCNIVNPDACSQGPTCQYGAGYGDGSFTIGTLSRETITFETTDGHSVSIPNIVFGCGHNDSGSIDGNQVGIAGFSSQPISIVSQLNPLIKGRFSYCLVPFHQKSSSSTMHFGDTAIIDGPNAMSTPLVDPLIYSVTLESISIGRKKINAKASSNEKGNMFIDSGTTVTLLKAHVLTQLADEVSAIVGIPITMDPGNTFYCYTASSRDDFPIMTFNFEGGASLVMEAYNTYTVPNQDGRVCLAMQATDGLPIFGNTVQQNFHIGYDLVGKKVSFVPMDCSKLLS